VGLGEVGAVERKKKKHLRRGAGISGSHRSECHGGGPKPCSRKGSPRLSRVGEKCRGEISKKNGEKINIFHFCGRS